MIVTGLIKVIANISKIPPLISFPLLLVVPSSFPQFVIRLPRGPLLDFYSKRSWGAASTLRSSHTGVSVTRGDSALSICTHQPLALFSPLLLPSPSLQHHCNILHLLSSAPLETLPPFFLGFLKQDCPSFLFWCSTNDSNSSARNRHYFQWLIKTNFSFA